MAKLNGVIANLQKDIQGLKKEIQERDETIQVRLTSSLTNHMISTGVVLTYILLALFFLYTLREIQEETGKGIRYVTTLNQCFIRKH